jgi:tetratricopeptide (TPR) repeat protein
MNDSSRSAGNSMSVLALGIALVVVAAFGPALQAGFLEWDDYENLAVNPHYRGLGPRQLWWMLTSAWSGHWAPLTWLTLSLDWVLWGRDPFGYHLTSVVLHAATGAVMFLVAHRLLACAMPAMPPATVRAGAAVAALFFALHPLRAESVVWVSERRDVVSGLFYVLTILAYLRAGAVAGAARGRWLVLSVAAYALAMASKAIVMSLPIVLLVLDVYPLRRRFRSVLWEKIPFAVIAVAGGAVAASVATEFKGAAEYPLWARPAVFGYNLVFYLGKTLVPLALSPLYEMPARWMPADPRLVVGLLLPAALTVALVALRRRWPAGLAVWIAYAVTLMPVAGLAVHTGPQIAADRYTYLACLGPALLVGAAVCLVTRAADIAASVRRAALTAVAVALMGLAVLSWQQSTVWRDDVTLWQHAVALDPACARCQNNLGIAQQDMAPAAAVAPLRRAVALRPDFPHFHANLGLVLLSVQRPADALPHLQRAADARPEDLILQSRLGAALAQTGDVEAAQRRLAAVLERRPDHVEALTAMGYTLTDAGRPADAVAYFERAVGRAPRASAARAGLVRAHLAVGNRARAERELAVLRELDPRLAEQVQRR